MTSAIYALIALSDRFRGHPGLLPKPVKRYLQAALVTLGCGITDPLAFHVVSIIVVLSLSAGSYGNAIGPALSGVPPSRAPIGNDPGPEWWQIGSLLDNSWLALVAVGMIWGLPSLLAFPLAPRVALIPIAFVIAFPLSCWLAKKYADGSWAEQQWLFGAIVALVLASGQVW